MNQCKLLHETILRDVIDVINDVKDFDEVEWQNSRNTTGSIAKRASNLILVFPVLVSSSLSIQTASLIAKAIERKCTSLLQILFSAVNLTSAENLQDYIAQFHTNLNRGLTLDDFMDVMSKLSESGEMEIIDKDTYNAVMEDMHNLNYYLNETYNPVSINNYRPRTDSYGNSFVVLEDAVDDAVKKMSGAVDKALNGINKSLDAQVKAFNNRTNKNSPDDASLKDQSEYFKNQLLPQDVQKANELMPTLVTVRFTTHDNVGLKHSQMGVIGVKAKLYPIDSMDIISRIASKYSDSNSLFNFIRATTREISFFRDFAFAIDKAKMDAINMGKNSNNSKVFKLLERRADKNKFTRLMKKNDASPITSLVMSQNEVEYLKKYNSIDMEKTYIAKTFLAKYNLMDIVIADESLEVAKFLYDDGDELYEVFPFDALEKEAKDSSYKKVINLMNKINR